MPKDYVEPLFMGLPIKCNYKYPTIKSILESLYVTTFKSAQTLTRPLGLHCRFRMNAGVPLKVVSGRFAEYFSKKYGYRPRRVTCIESDSSGSHYHMAVAIDGKKNTKYSLRHFFAEMKTKGLVADYDVISPKSSPHGYQLDDEKQAEEFFEWMSYIAKTHTKPSNRQKHSKDWDTDEYLTEWKNLGKPMLTIPGKSDAELYEVQPTGLSAFLNL